MSGGFDSLGLMSELVQSVAELGWSLPTDIQDEAIPLILGGGDVMAAAETGSGKTAAFCLPIIQCVHERLRNDEIGGHAKKKRTVSITISDQDRDATLNRDISGLICSSTSGEWAGARATHGVNSGKYYYECTVLNAGICRVGWSTMSAHLELGKDAYGFGYGGTGMKSVNGTFLKYGGEYTKGDVVGCFIDFQNKQISYSKNGVHLGVAFDIDNVIGTVLFPAVLLKNSSLSLNFGTSPFAFPPTREFSSLHFASPGSIFDADAKEAFAVKGKRKPMAIIIEPTKDLAEQVYENIISFTRYVHNPELRTVLIVGDDPKSNAEKQLEQGVDIVVGTYGKLSHLSRTGALDLSQIRFFVLDEADKLVSSDGIGAIMQLFSHCPGGGSGTNRLQVLH